MKHIKTHYRSLLCAVYAILGVSAYAPISAQAYVEYTEYLRTN